MNEQNLHINYEEVVPKLAERLKDLRAQTGLSKEKVANKAWISPYAYLQYEKGKCTSETPMNPRLKTLMSIAGVYGISIAQLLDLNSDIDVGPADAKAGNKNVASAGDATAGSSADGAIGSTMGGAIDGVLNGKAMGGAINGTMDGSAYGEVAGSNAYDGKATDSDDAYCSFAKQFGANLKRLRWERDMTMQDVTRKADIALSRYQYMEKGMSDPRRPVNPRLKTLVGLANAFDVSLSDLFDFNAPTISEKLIRGRSKDAAKSASRNAARGAVLLNV